MNLPDLSVDFLKEKIEIGKPYNYKKVTNLLGLKYLSGKSKQLQLEKLERYMKIKKVPNSHNYIIEEIYEDIDAPFQEPKSNAIYLKYIENIIISKLLYYYDEGYAARPIRWFKELGMINEMYISEKKDYNFKMFSYTGDIEESDNGYKLINDFYKFTYNRLYHIFMNTLESMKDRELIDYKKCYLINIEDPETKRLNKFVIANVKQESIIWEIEETASKILDIDVNSLWIGLSMNINKYKKALSNAIASYNLTDDAKENGYVRYIMKATHVYLNEKAKERLSAPKSELASSALYMLSLNSKKTLNKLIVDAFDKYYKKKAGIDPDAEMIDISGSMRLYNKIDKDFLNKALYNNLKKLYESISKIEFPDTFDQKYNYYTFYHNLIYCLISIN